MSSIMHQQTGNMLPQMKVILVSPTAMQEYRITDICHNGRDAPPCADRPLSLSEPKRRAEYCE